MELKEVDSKNFEKAVTESGKPVLIDFFATWCAPCRMLNPILEDINEELNKEVDIYKLNIDDSLEIAKQYNVLSVPTIVLFKNGEEVDRLIGLRQKSQIKELLSNSKK